MRTSTHWDRSVRCKRTDQSAAAVVCLMSPPANEKHAFTYICLQRTDRSQRKHLLLPYWNNIFASYTAKSGWHLYCAGSSRMGCKDGRWEGSLPFCSNTSTRQQFDGKVQMINLTVFAQLQQIGSNLVCNVWRRINWVYQYSHLIFFGFLKMEERIFKMSVSVYSNPLNETLS